MANHSAKHTLLPSSRTVVKGIQWFIIFTAVGTGLIIWWKTPHDIRELVHNFDWLFLIFLFPLVGIDYFLGGNFPVQYISPEFLVSTLNADCHKITLLETIMDKSLY